MSLPLTSSQKKVVLFGAIGAVGCFAAALLGELLLWTTRVPPQKQVAVCLVLDTSGSMAGSKLAEMKSAAASFVQRRHGSEDQIAVVAFDSIARVAAPLSSQHQALNDSLGKLAIGGSTNMSDGLRTAASQLSGVQISGNIVLFTDGMPDSPPDALAAAEECHKQGVKIIAIGTGDADTQDTGFLATLTRNPTLVFSADSGTFEQAFQQAEKAITGQLVESSPTGAGVVYSIFRIGTWTALLAAGIALALLVGQDYYLRRLLPDKRRALMGVLGGLAAGMIAGGLGQLMFAGTTEAHSVLVVIGRIIGWTILGSLVGLGLAFVVPNLKPTRALAAGAVGGAIGAIGFLIVKLILGEVIGRLLGAAIVGFCIGAMIALVEAVFREAWLEVQYGPKEIRNVTLGRKPVAIGSNPEYCAVLARGAPDIALRYSLNDGRIICEDVPSARSSDVQPGDRKSVGNLSVVVCAARPKAVSTTGLSGSRKPPEVPRPDERAATGTLSDGSDGAAFHLRIRGRRLPLQLAARLKKTDVAGLETTEMDGAVMEVSAHPTDAQILGLKNLSTRAWSATMSTGEQKQVEPGKSVRLATGTKINFGVLEGIVET